MESSRKKGKKQNNYLLVMIIISIIMISSGLYLNYYTNPRIQLSNTFEILIKIIENTKDNKKITGISENFSLNSNIKINIDSQSIQKSINPADVQNKKIIANLNNTTTNLVLIQDKTNKKMYANINARLGQEELLNSKYLVENATEYYSVKGIVNNYVNNGNSGYFEALNSATTSKENIIYILQNVSESLKKNLKSEYFVTSKVETSINNKKKKLNKVSLKLTDSTLKELFNNILLDLKEDYKSNQILTGLDKNFFKNISDIENKLFNYDEVITINMYNNIIGNLKKYELVYFNGQKESKLVYELDTKQIYYIENGKIIYDIKHQIIDKKQILVFYNESGEEQGKIVYDKTNYETVLSVNLKKENNTIDFIYDSKLENVEKNLSYNNKKDFILKVSTPSGNIINAMINIENKVTSSTMINEDLTTMIFASSITENEQQQLSDKLNTILMRLSN